MLKYHRSCQVSNPIADKVPVSTGRQKDVFKTSLSRLRRLKDIFKASF